MTWTDDVVQYKVQSTKVQRRVKVRVTEGHSKFILIRHIVFWVKILSLTTLSIVLVLVFVPKCNQMLTKNCAYPTTVNHMHHWGLYRPIKKDCCASGPPEHIRYDASCCQKAPRADVLGLGWWEWGKCRSISKISGIWALVSWGMCRSLYSRKWAVEPQSQEPIYVETAQLWDGLSRWDDLWSFITF